MENHRANWPPEEEIGFKELFAEAWAAKWQVLAITVVLAIIGITTGKLTLKQYRAEILISPVTDSSKGAGGALGALASQYGALASMAGVSISGRGSKDEAIAVLQSELITEAYIRDNDLLPVLYSDRWDTRTGGWKSNEVGKIPTLWMANQYFKSKIRTVKEEKGSGLVTLRITWRNPVLAAKWANDLVNNTNRYLRDKAIKESDQNIAYLNDEASKTTVLEVRTAIYSILKEELEQEMIAKGREEYALKVLDPAVPPQTSSSPSAALLGIVGFAAGLVISAILVWRRSSFGRTHSK
ncbi:MAG: Wzz/FepE/Etk N-terminal domain-containing protein [Pseudomonadota bacterium]|nr:Wzz/FepE/Etk N-terminal domain-containing protein [Pseudomonadota bacterium]